MRWISFAVLSAALLTPHAEARPGRSKGSDIVVTAAGAGSFKTLTTALVATGLDEALKGKGPFTVFAPTDEAFAKLPAGTLEKLLKPEGRDTLAAILKYHVVAGKRSSGSLGHGGDLTTLEGGKVAVRANRGKLKVNDVMVVKADVNASNGVIHVIDGVLLPPPDKKESRQDDGAIGPGRRAVEKAGGFTILLQALDAAGLAGVLDGPDAVTVFAPTDEAFRKLPAGTLQKLLRPESKAALTRILKYHVAAGKVSARDVAAGGKLTTLQGASVWADVDDDGRLAVNGARVVKANVPANSALVHAIDAVLMPPH